MTVREFYANLNSDFGETLRRLGNEDRIKRFLLKFADDGSYDRLGAALKEENFSEAFLCAHSLKGIAMNLGLTELASKSSELTEALRAKTYREDVPNLHEDLRCEYLKTLETLQKLER